MKAFGLGRDGLRFLLRNPRRTALMTLGPLVGVAALTAVVASARGAGEAIGARLRNFGDRALMVFAGDIAAAHGRGSGVAATLKLADSDAIREAVPGVVRVAPILREREIDVTRDGGGESATTALFGVDENFGPVWQWDVAEGTAIDDADAMRLVCVLGDSLRRELFGEADPIGARIRIGTKKFEVKGVLARKGTSPRGTDMDHRVLVPIATAMRRMFNRDHIGMVRVLLDDPDRIGGAKAAITDLLRRRHHIVPPEMDDFDVVTPDRVAEMVKSASGTMSTLLLVLAATALLAGGIVVMNVMLVSVRERRREIGLRRAVGATRGDIRVQFLLESAIVTMLGGAIGAALGSGVAVALRVLWRVPTRITWEPFALAVACSLVVGLLSGVWPARSAARLAPVDALRS